jgi:hypothetical protein
MYDSDDIKDEVWKRPLPYGGYVFVLHRTVRGREAIFTGRTVDDARRAADRFFGSGAATLSEVTRRWGR